MTLRTFYTSLLLATSSACFLTLVFAETPPNLDTPPNPDMPIKEKDLLKKNTFKKMSVSNKDTVSNPILPLSVKGDKNQPSVFQADTLDYNENEQLVTATGNVYITQGPKLLRADKVQYFQIQDKVIAEGNVWIKDEDGNYSFAQFAELTNKMNDGFVEEVKILMTDNSRASGNKSKRYNGEKLILWQGVYSPCPLCKADPNSFPLWQIKADKVIHDKEDQSLTYNHAWMEFLGVPTLYTPYFYHPDPSVKRKTGLLMPIYGGGKDTGGSLCLPFFIVTGQNHDITLYPTFTSKQGTILGAEFRHRLVDGEYTLSGSYAGGTKNDNPKEKNPEHLKKIPKERWHIFLDGRYDINDETIVKWIIRRASDLTYLLRFPVLHGGSTKIADVQGTLDSSISVENFRQTSYGVVKGYVFQSNDAKYTPVILPTATYLYETMPGRFSETWHFDANFLNLFREKGLPGKFGEKMIRGSLGGGVQVPYVTPLGDIWKLQANVRGDTYHINDFKTHFNSKAKDYNETRLFPQASLTWRFPLVQYTNCMHWVVEPAAMVITSSHGLNPIQIPDEDSPLVVVEQTNLFSMNRFYGYDRVDDGHRFVYGGHSRHHFTKGRKAFVFFGQSIRLDHHRVLPRISGEDRNASNYIASVLLAPTDWLEGRSRLMFNRKNWTVEIAESSGTIKTPWITGTIGHVYYNPRMTLNRQRVSQAIWGVSTPQFYKWTFSYTETMNVGDRRRVFASHKMTPRVLSRAGILQYNHECLITTISVIHTGYRDRDLRPDTKVLLQLDFKNLGSITPINILGLGGGSRSNED